VPCTATTSTMPEAPAETSAGEVEALRQQIAALQARGKHPPILMVDTIGSAMHA